MPLIFAGIISLAVLALLIIKLKTIWAQYQLHQKRLEFELSQPKRRGKAKYHTQSLRRV